MSNSYFQFKQFKIEQDCCAMKVSTDACIQGAWTPIDSIVRNILDIGTGTGLLSLMLAQRNEYIHIEGVELDSNAAKQAKENVAVSPWSERISIHDIDVKSFMPPKPFDMVICNPPFFQNSLQSQSVHRNMARHNESLSYKDLLLSIDKVLVEQGYASIMLPTAEFEVWENLLQANGWYVATKLLVKPRGQQPNNRVIGLCKRGIAQKTTTEELCIYEEGKYTNAFSALMKPYYLNL